MFIDMEKIDDIDAIAKICHEEHNVPNVPETNHQVKWIWAEPFHALFHDISHEGLQEKYNDVPFVTTCNHCLQASLRQSLPNPGNLPERKRRPHPSGYAPLHRLP